MAPSSDQRQEPVLTSQPLPHAEQIAHRFGLVLNNSVKNCWFSDTDKRDALHACHQVLEEAFDLVPEVIFKVVGEVMQVNGHPVELESSMARFAVKHFTDLNLNNLALIRGITEEELAGCLAVLSRRPAELEAGGGLADALESEGLRNIRVRHLIFREVDEQDTVVSREAATVVDAVNDPAVYHNILAFLRGETEGAGEDASDQLRQQALDPAGLARLILRAADVRQEAQLDGGEDLGRIVVGCLRRAFKALKNHAQHQTQKGRKQLSRQLMVLEQDILEQLRARMDEEDGALGDEVSDAIEGMREELQIDALASEFLKKTKALETSEKRLLRFIQRQGLEDEATRELQQQLEGGGLELMGWQSLLMKSGAGGGGPGGGGVEAIQQLAVLLARLEEQVEEDVRQKRELTEELRQALRSVDGQVSHLTDTAREKIDRIAEALKEDMEAVLRAEEAARKHGEPRKVTRARLLEILAEVVQELFQPLTVIMSTLDMLRSGRLGEVSDAQLEMLSLATGSAGKIQTLVEHLKGLSGLPTGLHPDAEILGQMGVHEYEP